MHEAHDALICIGHKTYVNEKNRLKFTDQHYLKTNSEMSELFADLPEALENNYNFPYRCNFRPTFSNPVLPNISSDKDGNAASCPAMRTTQLNTSGRWNNDCVQRRRSWRDAKITGMFATHARPALVEHVGICSASSTMQGKHSVDTTIRHAHTHANRACDHSLNLILAGRRLMGTALTMRGQTLIAAAVTPTGQGTTRGAAITDARTGLRASRALRVMRDTMGHPRLGRITGILPRQGLCMRTLHRWRVRRRTAGSWES